MRKLKLLDAIGNIDDKLIEEAAPQNHMAKTRINWTKYGSLAACICLFLVGVWAFRFASDSLSKSSASDMVAPESAESLDGYNAVTQETAEEAIAEEAPESEEKAAVEEAPVAEEAPAEEAIADETVAGTSSVENDIAYSFTMNGTNYYPISFTERKQFDLLPENATGLTPENNYQITESDLGEVMGTVEISANETLIGATVYHFAKFPKSDAICIVEYNGTYEFYVNSSVASD